MKELHHKNIYYRGEWILADSEKFDHASWPEEREGIIRQYKTQGIHRNNANVLQTIKNAEDVIDLCNTGIYNTKYHYTPFTRKWYHFIYKTPRKW